MKKDFFKQLYPLTKLFLSLTLILSAFIVPSYIYGYSMIIICGIIVSLENKSKVYCKRIFFSLFWLFTAIFIIQSIFLPSGEVWMKFGFISIYKEGVMKAVNLTSKLTAVVSALTMLTLITPVKTFTLALEKKGLNPKAAFILMLTLQMIPEMKKQANVIMDSQKARGVETEGNVFVRAKALIPVFIPLVLSSIANTEERAIMLEARGFSIGEKRTILYDIEETKNDKIMKIMLAIFIVLCIVWRVLWVISK
ncbi:energy-coupling factor transporter transmembrane component T [Leptotrichia buccalis]|jgi:cobalt transport protein|uniref:Cobalt transport protein n=1 Tax=Leptotrichia buccalis (strain ATCC 14201 / DSM 1135 / JCM 12969 / NCTC 10249 / C-1013-b) TaxID=523794 RepID=C7NE29_LEPBD|nr:energy-coupling factor transporter transmembrane component T [Leptotrichia buccalis]ACV38224.1 cobalt transport protein [Leptotrichia buccalis C-1013-b]